MTIIVSMDDIASIDGADMLDLYDATKNLDDKLEIDSSRLRKVKFEESDLIDQGAFGEVFRDTYRKQRVAIKRLKATVVTGMMHTHRASTLFYYKRCARRLCF